MRHDNLLLNARWAELPAEGDLPLPKVLPDLKGLDLLVLIGFACGILAGLALL